MSSFRNYDKKKRENAMKQNTVCGMFVRPFIVGVVQYLPIFAWETKHANVGLVGQHVNFSWIFIDPIIQVAFNSLPM